MSNDHRTLETQIRRYDKTYRRRLRKLAKTSPRLGDLIYTYPAAAFALASGYGDVLHRAEATALVKKGASLRQVGAELGLPSWFRALPPEAFVETLPRNLQREDEHNFGRQIVNTIPADPTKTAVWLSWVLEARDACDDKFAIWLAGRMVIDADWDPPVSALAPVAAFAWVSQYGGGVAMAQMSRRRRWRKSADFGAVVHETADWMARLVVQECSIDDDAARSSWSQKERCAGFEFVPLLTVAQLEQEGRAMNHCVATYADPVQRRECLIYSIQQGGVRHATLEVRADPRRPGRGRICQLLGPLNAAAPETVWRAAEKWIAGKRGCPAVTRGRLFLELDPTRWRRTWADYWAAKGERGALIKNPTERTLMELYRSLDRLGRLV